MPEAPAQRKQLTVTIHDGDDGTVSRIPGAPEELVQAVVDEFFRDHLHRDRREGDRLRCDDTGDDVFAHLGEHLEEYRARHCKDLTWNFSGDQGGAER